MLSCTNSRRYTETSLTPLKQISLKALQLTYLNPHTGSTSYSLRRVLSESFNRQSSIFEYQSLFCPSLHSLNLFARLHYAALYCKDLPFGIGSRVERHCSDRRLRYLHVAISFNTRPKHRCWLYFHHQMGAICASGKGFPRSPSRLF